MPDATTLLFQTGSLEERARLALDPASAPAIRAFLGDPAYDDYAQLAERVQRAAARRHLAAADTNLVFIPGVMGSQLMSSELGGVWWIDARTRAHLDHLRLNPDGSGSAQPTYRVEPFTTDPSYEPFRAAALERDDFSHVVFPYDWRLPLEHGAARLRDQLIALYATNGGRKIHLVAHSMGGLLVRSALAAHGAALWPIIGRIAFLATPHYGSPAIAGYLKNHLWGWEMMAVLGRYLSRETFRSLWGVLQLLPAPLGIYPGTRAGGTYWQASDPGESYPHPCANFDLYQADQWRLDLDAAATANLQRVLDGAAAFHTTLHQWQQGLDDEWRARMAMIAGVGFNTLFRLEYSKQFFGLWEHTKKITERVPGDPHRDGDGRVPLASAALEGIGALRYVRAEHGALPSVPAVYEDVFRWLNKTPMQLARTPQGALGDHLAADQLAPCAPHLSGSGADGANPEDPGYWHEQPYTDAQLAALDARLAGGDMPGFNRLHIL